MFIRDDGVEFTPEERELIDKPVFRTLMHKMFRLRNPEQVLSGSLRYAKDANMRMVIRPIVPKFRIPVRGGGGGTEREGLSSIKEFLERHKLPRSRFHTERNAGRLKTVLLGRRRYITPEDERAWIALLRSEE